MRLLTEVLNGITTVKFFGWEAHMQQSILDFRRREVNILRRLALWNGITTLSSASAPFLMVAATLGVYVVSVGE